MRITTGGRSASTSAPSLAAALETKLKNTIKTVDAMFLGIDTSAPIAKSATMKRLMAGVTASPVRRFRDDVDRVERDVLAVSKRANDMLHEADAYCAGLRALGEHIKTGVMIPDNAALPQELIGAALTLRRVMQSGDESGHAGKAASTLLREADQAAATIATAFERTRKHAGAIRAACFNQRAKAFEAMSLSAGVENALVTKAEIDGIRASAVAHKTAADGYTRAFRSTFYGSGYRRNPTLKCVPAHRLLRTQSGFSVIPEGS